MLALQSSALQAKLEKVCDRLMQTLETAEIQMKFPQMYTLCNKIMGYQLLITTKQNEEESMSTQIQFVFSEV